MILKLDVLNFGFSSSTYNCILNIFLSFFYGWNPIWVLKIVIPAQVNLCHMSCNNVCHAVGLNLQSGHSWVENDTIEYNTANASHPINWAWVLLIDGLFEQKEKCIVIITALDCVPAINAFFVM